MRCLLFLIASVAVSTITATAVINSEPKDAETVEEFCAALPTNIYIYRDRPVYCGKEEILYLDILYK